MNCPKCTTPIESLGKYCVKCGHDFGSENYNKLFIYFELKKEFDHLGAIRGEFASSLTNLDKRMRDYGNLINLDLAKIAGAPQQSPQSQPAPKPGPEQTAPIVAAGPATAIARPGTIEPRPVAPEPAFTSAPAPKRSSSEFEIQMGQKWLLIVGILTMVFGVGYFLKYSFDQGWVGPEGRVALAYVWGIVFLVAGDQFRKKIERFGLSLIGGGIAVLYFSAFAAFQIYHLFDQTASFAIMVMITALACALAIRYDNKWLAVLGLVGGFLTPVLLTTGQDNQIALMTYMTILNLGLLGIAFYKKWDLLNTLGFIFTYLLYAAWYGQHYAAPKFWPAILFLNVFFLIYAFVPFTYQVRKAERSDGRELALMGANAFIAFGYCYAMIEHVYGVAWVSIITVSYACVFLGMATYLYQRGLQSLDVFVVMLAKAMLFLIITVPVLFSNHWITVFWSAQAFAIIWMAVKLERRSLFGGGYVLLVITVLKFLLHDYEHTFQMHLINGFSIYSGYTYLILERSITTALLLSSVLASALLAKHAPAAIQWSEKGDARVLFTIFGVLLFITLTAEVASCFQTYLPQARFAAVSVLWTLFSVVLMLMGFRRNIVTLRKISFGLFLVVVLKVFLFDMANVSTPYRIISFIILGLMLVGTSYLYYQHKDKIMSALADTEKQE